MKATVYYHHHYNLFKRVWKCERVFEGGGAWLGSLNLSSNHHLLYTAHTSPSSACHPFSFTHHDQPLGKFLIWEENLKKLRGAGLGALTLLLFKSIWSFFILPVYSDFGIKFKLSHLHSKYVCISCILSIQLTTTNAT